MPDSGDYYINGTDPGLVFPPERPPDKYVPPGQPTVYLTNPHNASVTLMVVARGYTASDPVPGSCHKLPYKPSVAVRWDGTVTNISWSLASLYNSSKLCNEPHEFHYQVYRLFLPERGLKDEQFFRGMRQFLDIEQIRRHGSPVTKLSRLNRAVFASFPATGSLFAVVVSRGNGTSAYVTSHTVTIASHTIVQAGVTKKKYTLFWPFEIWQQEVLMNYSLLPKLRSIRLVVSEYEVPKVLVSEECIFFSWEPDL